MLVRKGLLTNEEVLEEIKVVRRELEGKRGPFAAHVIVMCKYEIGGVPNERIIERRDNTTI